VSVEQEGNVSEMFRLKRSQEDVLISIDIVDFLSGIFGVTILLNQPASGPVGDVQLPR